jgi:putative transposase
MDNLKEKYFTAIDLANRKLPGLPKTESAIIRKSKKESWKRRIRKGRGGGWEYSFESFPKEAQMALLEKLHFSESQPEESLHPKAPATIKPWQRKEADKRFTIVQEFLEIVKDVPAGKRTEFKRKYSKQNGFSYRTLDGWVKSYQAGGYNALVPSWNNGEPNKIITPKMAKFIENSYLQPFGPPVKKVHEDLCEKFSDKCEQLPTYRTVAAFINSKWTQAQQMLIRDREQWDRLYSPYVRRDWTKVELNEVWVGDHKQIDVACLFRGKAVFPWLTVVEEAFSRKYVGWLLVPTPNSLSISQSFLYAASKYGPPKTFYCDRGRDYRGTMVAGKKEKRDINGDLVAAGVPGLLQKMGTEIFLAAGRNGREKIIEPSFGIFTDRSAPLPGYRGHSIKTRPKKLTGEIKSENLLTFEELSLEIDKLINDRNARPHSTTRISPDSCWEGFQPVVPSQNLLDFLLMDVHQATVKDSSVLVEGLLYRGDELFKLAGEKVEVRRDPKNIQRAVIIHKDQLFGEAKLETPDHYRSEITLQSVKDAARIRRKIKKFRQEVIDNEDVINDPLKVAVELDQKEKVRVRDIRPAESRVKGFNRQEKLARDVSDMMKKTGEFSPNIEPEDDILSRYLAASVGKTSPVGRTIN